MPLIYWEQFGKLFLLFLQKWDGFLTILLETFGVLLNADQDVSRMLSAALLYFANVVDSIISCAKRMLSEPVFLKCLPETCNLSCLL